MAAKELSFALFFLEDEVHFFIQHLRGERLDQVVIHAVAEGYHDIVFVVVGGMRYVLSEGNDQKIKQAKDKDK